MEDWAKLIEAVAKLIGAAIWPALILFAIFRFRVGIAAFVSNLTEFSFKGAGIDFSAKAKQQVMASLAAASAKGDDGEVTPEAVKKNAEEAAQISEAIRPATIRQTSVSTVLWVDDRPSNNVYEREALEALGVTFVLATSTEQALEQLGIRRFDLVITDMNRRPDPRAGLNLIKQMKAAGISTPTIIYASSGPLGALSPDDLKEAFGVASRANPLFKLVLAALKIQ